MKNVEAGLDPDEPHTPAWFTFLGLGLFLLGGIFFLVQSSDEAEATPPAAAGEEQPADMQDAVKAAEE